MAANAFQQKYPNETSYNGITSDSTNFVVPGIEGMLTGIT
jgi:hypothetical protein